MKHLKRFNEKIETSKTLDKEKMSNYKDHKGYLAYTLVDMDIPDDVIKNRLGQLNKRTAFDFILDGYPSQEYYEEVINLIEEYGGDVEDIK